MKPSDPRLEQLATWLGSQPGWAAARLTVASADASFRRYFRAHRPDGRTRVVMDAPPGKEDIRPYLQVAALLAGCGVHVPAIDAADMTQGFILLEDLGDTHMLASLESGASAPPLYDAALSALAAIQMNGVAAARQLPPYDHAALWRELQLLPDWYCARHLRLALEPAELALLHATFERLIAVALEQPVVLVHRDYHSRNLMVMAERNPGIIDFQDALAGPVTYDLVSLLKDCYIAWPRATVVNWVSRNRAMLIAAGHSAGADEAQYLRWFDYMGLQRHLKVLGIFARLFYRDGKRGFLADLPRTLAYVRETAARYAELREFGAWVEARLAPGLPAANARASASAIPASA